MLSQSGRQQLLRREVIEVVFEFSDCLPMSLDVLAEGGQAPVKPLILVELALLALAEVSQQLGQLGYLSVEPSEAASTAAEGLVNFGQPPPDRGDLLGQGRHLGWQTMPGGVVTDMAPAAAGRRSAGGPGYLFVFAKTPGPRGEILFNQAAQGGAFVGWQAVPGGVVTDAPVAAGMQGQTLVVFAKAPVRPVRSCSTRRRRVVPSWGGRRCGRSSHIATAQRPPAPLQNPRSRAQAPYCNFLVLPELGERPRTPKATGRS